MAAASPVCPPVSDFHHNDCPICKDGLEATWKQDVQSRRPCCGVLMCMVCWKSWAKNRDKVWEKILNIAPSSPLVFAEHARFLSSAGAKAEMPAEGNVAAVLRSGVRALDLLSRVDRLQSEDPRFDMLILAAVNSFTGLNIPPG